MRVLKMLYNLCIVLITLNDVLTITDNVVDYLFMHLTMICKIVQY